MSPSKKILSAALASAGIAIMTAALLGVAVADHPADGATRRNVNAQTRQLHVMLDKPLYRPGETVWLRTWEMTAQTLRPATSASVVAKLLDPKGSAIMEETLPARAGMAKAALDLPATLAGGTYTLELRSAAGTLERRKIVVSTYELPKWKKTIRFDKTSYNPGDRIEVSVEVAQATGEALSRARVSGWIWLDGREIARVNARADRAGLATLRFRLPASMARGDGLLTVVVDHRGATESIQRRIPIVVDAISVRSFPEGGDLVAGLTSRVYFDASDMLGNPIALSGSVVDEGGAVIAPFKTDVRGMGHFSMTPVANKRYFLEAAGPRGDKKRFAMRAVRGSGCVLSTGDDAAVKSSEIEIEVACTQDAPIAISAFLRGRSVASLNAHASAGSPVGLRLPLGRNVQGVVRVMLTASNRATAERLIYRGVGRDLSIEIKSDRERYQPRDKVTLALKTRRADGAAVSADLALAVVDETVFETANDKTGHILSKLYLEPEMPGQRIDDPNFYFSGTEEAMRGLDQLLGTRGWRRFR